MRVKEAVASLVLFYGYLAVLGVVPLILLVIIGAKKPLLLWVHMRENYVLLGFTVNANLECT
ncbi:hypothetical protein CD133_00795 [Staphylococcus massiliensis CCUG 55927]|nr:hypothetical protein CD133_00795 [Staphylococcus massiliensis CCUG 55927]